MECNIKNYKNIVLISQLRSPVH